ncbi:MAG TPA: hypothetical protein PLB48_03815 [Treponema sp.]|nr:hypothetical protein [Treponema sp.]
MKVWRMFYNGTLLLLGTLLVLGYTACTTVPAALTPGTALQSKPFAELPPGADLYVYLDLQRSQNIINTLYQKGGIPSLKRVPQKSIGYARQVYGALYTEGSKQRFYAKVSGQFPVFRTALSLTLSPDWKKKRSGALSYWRSDKNGLSLTLTSRMVTLTDGIPQYIDSNQIPASDLGSSIEVPEAVEITREELADSNLYIVLTSPDRLVKSALGTFGPLGQELQIPLKQIRLKLSPSSMPKTYTVEARLITTSPSYGRALGALLSLGTVFLNQPIENSEAVLRQLGTLLLSERPSVEGAVVSLLSKPIDESELTLLLQSILVYFDRIKTL